MNNLTLQEISDKFDNTFKISPNAMMITKISDGKFVEVNDAFYHITGYSYEDIINDFTSIKMNLWVNIEDREQVVKNLKEKGKVYNKRYKFRKKNGEIMEGLYSSTLINLNNDLHVISSVSDITEVVKSENIIFKQNELLETILNSIPVMIMLFEHSGKWKYVNEFAQSTLGWPFEEFQRHENIFEEFYPDPEYRNQVLDFINKAAGSKNWGDFKTKIRDGSILDTAWSNVELSDNSIIGIGIDNTSRKKIEKDLIDSENKILLLLNSTAEAIYGLDMDGNCTFCNKSCLDMLGYKHSDELLGKNMHWQIHGKYEDGSHFPVEDCPIFQTFNKGENAHIYNEVLWRSDGTSFPVEYWSYPQYDDGIIVGSVVTFMDITDKIKEAEEKAELEYQITQLDKMEALGTLAGGIAHDFNNLLMGIQGCVSLMLIKSDTNDYNNEKLKQIEDQITSGSELTKQLLGFARRGKYDVKPTNINKIIESNASMFGRTKKEITIHRNLEKNIHTINVDRGQMDQIFVNLFINAWQAMPNGGELYIETSNVNFDEKRSIMDDFQKEKRFLNVKPGKYIKISITDTGIGMNEKIKKRIFEPFFTTKEMGRGTGLGLATVYGIIKNHNGFIDVHSVAEQGTTFNIYFPTSEEIIHEEKKQEIKLLKGTETILLVDDEKIVLEMTKHMLQSLGYKIYAVGSGQEAIAVYMEKKDEIDMIMIDMIMPGISGKGTIDRIKILNPNLKILLSSGYSINGQAQEIMDKGCNGFIQKPFRQIELSQKVREVLEG